ncbi:YczE/YyaS/YitT family protein [Ruminiclostridium cellobioparum]|uniref:Putative membrane protein n=1 Tax=Ruminiclostridium cellobioparum subsp. termitidis CT1112 TaxID=1195236 RepID=S0FGG8_RUMCE|nr:putative membrane protein [Ruminiclostridium cellobioparum]EMS70540.1 putative membrane protein [Ruminiclostridium cellobioparum subsp. termitidis CT1112]
MSEKYRRVVMTVFGVLTAGFSVGMFNFSAFGMDPFQVLAHGISMHMPLGYGTFYSILNLLMLIVIFFVDRRKIGLGTFINIFLLGYVVQFSSWLFDSWMPNPSLGIKLLFLIIAVVIMCFGSSLYFTGDLGVSTYDAVALILSEKKVARFQFCRIGSDFICTVCGYLFGATVGIGTLITAFFMGPVIAVFNRKVAIPLRYGRNREE